MAEAGTDVVVDDVVPLRRRVSNGQGNGSGS